MSYSDHALPFRSHLGYDCWVDSGGSHFTGINAHQIIVNRAGIDEGVTVHDGYAVRDPLVYVCHIRDAVTSVVVVDIRDLNHCHTRIRNVDPFHVTRTRVIPGHVNFARAEREPSHRSSTDADTDSTDECNQRRGIHRTN